MVTPEFTEEQWAFIRRLCKVYSGIYVDDLAPIGDEDNETHHLAILQEAKLIVEGDLDVE